MGINKVLLAAVSALIGHALICLGDGAVTVVQSGETQIRGEGFTPDGVIGLLDVKESDICCGNLLTGNVYRLKKDLFPYTKASLQEFAKCDRLPIAYEGPNFGWQIQTIISSNAVIGISAEVARVKLEKVKDYLLVALKGREVWSSSVKDKYVLTSQETVVGHWVLDLAFKQIGPDCISFTLRIHRDPYVSPIRCNALDSQVEVDI